MLQMEYLVVLESSCPPLKVWSDVGQCCHPYHWLGCLVGASHPEVPTGCLP